MLHAFFFLCEQLLRCQCSGYVVPCAVQSVCQDKYALHGVAGQSEGGSDVVSLRDFLRSKDSKQVQDP